MKHYRLNQIAMAVLGALLLFFGTRTLINIIYEEHEPEKPGLEVAGTEEKKPAEGEKPAAAAAAGSEILALLPTADAKQGEADAGLCKVCHSFEKGVTMIGPPLHDVVGRKIASVEGFGYSPALKAHAEQDWTYENLDAFITNPQAFAPGTIMGYPGEPNAKKRADIIAFLRSQTENPPPLPEASAAPAASEEKAPAAAEPAPAAPQEAAPEAAEPAPAAPQEATPEAAEPAPAAPEEAAPEAAEPAPAAPEQAAPEAAEPAPAAPEEAAPQAAEPAPAAPEETAPEAAEPAPPAPTETAPEASTPAQAAPEETEPEAAAPAPAPAEETPATKPAEEAPADQPEASSSGEAPNPNWPQPVYPNGEPDSASASDGASSDKPSRGEEPNPNWPQPVYPDGPPN